MDLFGILGFIGDSIDSQVGALASFVTSGFASLLGDVTGVWGVLTGFIGWAVKAVGSIVSFLRDVWDWLKNHILSKIINTIQQIIARIRQWLKPFIQWVQLERQLLYRMWYQYVRPIMNFLQSLRRFLLVFRLLGFKWAQQLDAYLVKLENKINAAFLGALQNLNVLADWINWITDPFGIFQPAAVWGAISGSAGALWGIIFGTPTSGLPGAANPGNTAGTQLYTPTAQMQRVVLRSALGGPTPEDVANANAIISAWQRLGYPEQTV